MGVTAGVPPRVEAGMKSALLDLVDGAVEAGWTTARACAVLELDGHRCRRWRHRRDAGRLDDHTAGGVAVHAITPAGPLVVVGEVGHQLAQTPPRERQPQNLRARRGGRHDELYAFDGAGVLI